MLIIIRTQRPSRTAGGAAGRAARRQAILECISKEINLYNVAGHGSVILAIVLPLVTGYHTCSIDRTDG